MTGNVVSLHDPRQHAQQVKARLWNPKNARQSSELDVFSGSELRRRREAELKQREEAKRAEADFRREIALDDLMRAAVADHAQAKRIAEEIQIEETTPPPKVRRIIRAVAQAYGASLVDILSRRRTAAIVRPRQVAMYLAKRLTFRSLPEIGHMLGGRDHTTVLHAVRKIEALVTIDAELKSKIDGILDQLAETA